MSRPTCPPPGSRASEGIGRALSRRTVLGLLTGMPLAATGCVSVPTTGPVAPVTPSSSTIERGGDIDVRPPETDAPPISIVNSFLEAMASGDGDLARARLFLLPELVPSWQPTGALIFPTSTVPQVTGDAVVLDVVSPVGQLDDHSAFRPLPRRYRHDFGMRRDAKGQWRIGHPPEVLLIAQGYFEYYYSSYNIYFFAPSFLRLVPDPIFLPYAPSSTQLAGALVQALIQGPTDFLRASVRNAVPAGTQLQAQSVVTADGVAELQLGDPVLALNDRQREQLVAEIGWTLNQVVDINGLRINGGTFRVGASIGDGADSYVPISSTQEYGPVPDVVSTLFGLRGKAMVTVDEADGRPEAHPVPGPLGAGDYDLTAVAVSESVDDVAAVTKNAELFVGPLGGPLKRVLSKVGALLRPQVIGQETWAISQRGGDVRLWVVRAGKAVEVDSSALPTGAIRAFRLAPDGVRIAVVRDVEGGTELGLLAVDRGSDVLALRPWRSIEVVGFDANDTKVVVDVDWQGSTTLMVLAGADLKSSVEPYSVSQDGYTFTKIGPPNDWGSRSLTATPTTPTLAMIVGAGNVSYQFVSQSRWTPFASDLRFLTYPG